ncbi:Alpha/beta hydrolase family protein [Amycolatopsis regifaucium]|nr:Alpha/beta hydrolase family protein [Amycolatopsis regifaucium]
MHLGLPLTGRRFPEGGFESFFRLASEDNVLNVVEPLTRQVEAEFPAALAELRFRLSIEDGPIGLVGGSPGGAVALQLLTHPELAVAASALVNPVTQLAPVIAANERVYEYDYVRRAEELSAPVLLVIGEEDDVSIIEPAEALHKALGERRSELVTIPGMAHGFAEAPGFEPAPQTAHARLVDAGLTRWFARHLAV